VARDRSTQRKPDKPKTQPAVPSRDTAAVPTVGPGEARKSRRPRRVRANPAEPLAQALAAQQAPVVPKAFPNAGDAERSRYLHEVAEGGMGIVSCSFDTVLLRRFARKTMHNAADKAPQLALRFIEEAQITAQLDHPGIVPVHDLGLSADDGRLYFTMKLVDGETLATLLERLHEQPFSGTALEQMLRLFVKICEAVSFAHSRGVIHRDLKPDNIMVGSHGQVYVMDWGIALLLSDGSSEPPTVSVGHSRKDNEAGTAVGTYAYMAPEQAHGRIAEQGPATDVYGLGAILYALLTRDGPHAARTPSQALASARIGSVPPPEVRPAWPTLPPGLCAIAMTALAPAPEDRYASVDALKSDVEEFLRGGGWFQVRSFDAGTEIVCDGDAADAAYIVTQGRCEVFRIIDGVRTVVRHIGPGEIFGEMGLLTQRPRVASVVALERVRAMVITPEALDRELDRTSWLRILVEALASRFRELDQELVARSPKR
jgi:tRNA A-37 threonylcarbamoyl transferase component Bud32